MRTFEYDIRPFDCLYLSEIADKFCDLGKKGWEVVQWTEADRLPGYNFSIWITLKREIVNDFSSS